MKARERFGSRWGFILSCVGSAVGMGNIWLFPYRMATYGGAFLVVYFFFTAIMALPGVIGEMSFGRLARSGPIGAFGAAAASRHEKGRKIGQLIGSVPVLGSLVLAIGYAVVVGWILHYTIGSFTGSALAPENADGFGAAFGTMASAFGNNLWQLVGLAITFLIAVFGIAGGIERLNKVLIPIFYLLFIGLAIYVMFLPGAGAGYAWMFGIHWQAFTDPMLYLFALGQAFFSLSLAGHGTIIYGSYLSEKVNPVSTAITIGISDTAAALLASVVIIPAMAAANGSILSESGPGLMFISLPSMFQTMPGGQIIMIVFFVAVFFAGLTSLLNLFEAPIAALQDHFRLKRPIAVAIIAAVAVGVSLCIQGIVGEWMDVASIYITPIGAALAGIFFAWVWGRTAVEDAVSTGRPKRIGRWYYPLYKFGFCIGTVGVFVIGTIVGGIG